MKGSRTHFPLRSEIIDDLSSNHCALLEGLLKLCTSHTSYGLPLMIQNCITQKSLCQSPSTTLHPQQYQSDLFCFDVMRKSTLGLVQPFCSSGVCAVLGHCGGSTLKHRLDLKGLECSKKVTSTHQKMLLQQQKEYCLVS